MRCSGARFLLLFQPVRELVGDPVVGVLLVLEARDVFPCSIGPLDPDGPLAPVLLAHLQRGHHAVCPGSSFGSICSSSVLVSGAGFSSGWPLGPPSASRARSSSVGRSMYFSTCFL